MLLDTILFDPLPNGRDQDALAPNGLCLIVPVQQESVDFGRELMVARPASVAPHDLVEVIVGDPVMWHQVDKETVLLDALKLNLHQLHDFRRIELPIACHNRTPASDEQVVCGRVGLVNRG